MENRHGLTTQVAYTYSHEIDEVTNDLNSLSNPFNPHYDHGSGGFDRRHILNVNYIYNLPFFAAQFKPARSARPLGGWQFSGITVAQSGTPALHSHIPAPTRLGLGGGTHQPSGPGGAGLLPKEVGCMV